MKLRWSDDTYSASSPLHIQAGEGHSARPSMRFRKRCVRDSGVHGRTIGTRRKMMHSRCRKYYFHSRVVRNRKEETYLAANVRSRAMLWSQDGMASRVEACSGNTSSHNGSNGMAHVSYLVR